MYQEMTRNNQNTALENPMLMAAAPSIFATQPHHEVSDRYGFQSTIDVVDALRFEGWMPVSASQKNVRDMSKRELTKHLVRFRRVDDNITVGDSVVELLLTNSHDRSSAFVLHAGIFRMACANGIVIADSTFQKLSVRHGKNIVSDIIEGSYSVIEEVPTITNQVETMQAIDLNHAEQHLLAKTAYEYTHGSLAEHPEVISSIGNITEQMLQPRRRADTGSDLWTTFNKVQESTLKGGVTISKLSAKRRGGYGRSTTRAVNSIDKNIKLNKALWEMANQMAELKAG